MIIILWIGLVNNYLIVNQMKKQYPIGTTQYGFVPYGRNISGLLSILSDLCISSNTQHIILTSFSSSCSLQQQLINGKQAQAVIFNNFVNVTDYTASTQIILKIDNKYYDLLKTHTNMTVTINFEIIKTIFPIIKYVIYEINQSIDTLRYIQQLKLYIEPVYYTYQTNHNLYFNLVGERNYEYDDGFLMSERTYMMYNDPSGKQTTLQIVYENLRQICIYYIYPIDQWVQYRIIYVDQCLIFEDSESIYQCSIVLRTQLNINETLIQGCVNGSFGEGVNYLFETQCRLSHKISNTYYKQSGYILINDQQIDGDYLVQNDDYYNIHKSTLLNAICESYSGSKPQMCPQIAIQQDTNLILWLIIVSSIILLILFICYFRKLYLEIVFERQKMMQQINLLNSQLSQKLNIDDE